MKYDEVLIKLFIDIYYKCEGLCVFKGAGICCRTSPRFQFVNITYEVTDMIDTSKRYLHFTFGSKWSIRVVRYVKTDKGFYIKTLKSI